MNINIRNSVRALVIKEEKLLCTKNRDDAGFYYLLPGGGQKTYETMFNALKRECLEEISAEIIVGDLVYINEYIGPHPVCKEAESDMHQIDFIFECHILDDKHIGNGNLIDSTQVDVAWLELKKIADYRIYPNTLKKMISEKGLRRDKIYLDRC